MHSGSALQVLPDEAFFEIEGAVEKKGGGQKGGVLVVGTRRDGEEDQR